MMTDTKPTVHWNTMHKHLHPGPRYFDSDNANKLFNRIHSQDTYSCCNSLNDISEAFDRNIMPLRNDCDKSYDTPTDDSIQSTDTNTPQTNGDHNGTHSKPTRQSQSQSQTNNKKANNSNKRRTNTHKPPTNVLIEYEYKSCNISTPLTHTSQCPCCDGMHNIDDNINTHLSEISKLYNLNRDKEWKKFLLLPMDSSEHTHAHSHNHSNHSKHSKRNNKPEPKHTKKHKNNHQITEVSPPINNPSIHTMDFNGYKVDKPLRLRIVSIAYDSICLEWNNGEFTVDKYQLYMRICHSKDKDWYLVYQGTARTYSVPNLVPNTQYLFRVRYQCLYGMSPYNRSKKCRTLVNDKISTDAQSHPPILSNIQITAKQKELRKQQRKNRKENKKQKEEMEAKQRKKVQENKRKKELAKQRKKMKAKQKAMKRKKKERLQKENEAKLKAKEEKNMYEEALVARLKQIQIEKEREEKQRKLDAERAKKEERERVKREKQQRIKRERLAKEKRKRLEKERKIAREKEEREEKERIAREKEEQMSVTKKAKNKRKRKRRKRNRNASSNNNSISRQTSEHSSQPSQVSQPASMSSDMYHSSIKSTEEMNNAYNNSHYKPGTGTDVTQQNSNEYMPYPFNYTLNSLYSDQTHLPPPMATPQGNEERRCYDYIEEDKKHEIEEVMNEIDGILDADIDTFMAPKAEEQIQNTDILRDEQERNMDLRNWVQQNVQQNAGDTNTNSNTNAEETKETQSSKVEEENGDQFIFHLPPGMVDFNDNAYSEQHSSAVGSNVSGVVEDNMGSNQKDIVNNVWANTVNVSNDNPYSLQNYAPYKAQAQAQLVQAQAQVQQQMNVGMCMGMGMGMGMGGNVNADLYLYQGMTHSLTPQMNAQTVVTPHMNVSGMGVMGHMNLNNNDLDMVHSLMRKTNFVDTDNSYYAALSTTQQKKELEDIECECDGDEDGAGGKDGAIDDQKEIQRGPRFKHHGHDNRHDNRRHHSHHHSGHKNQYHHKQ